MKTVTAFAVFAFCLAVSGAAYAQGAVQPGTEFPAAPISHGGFSLGAPAQIIAPAPPPPVVIPAPEPTPKKHRKRHKTSS